MGNLGDEIAMASISSRCDEIRAALDLFTKTPSPEYIIQANQLICSLRRDYKKNPSIFDSFLGELKVLTEEIRRESELHTEVLIDEYVLRCARAKETLAHKDALRDVFVEMCKAIGKEQVEFKNSASCLHAKRITRLKLPPPLSQEMKDLESIIVESGLWEEATKISGAKVKKILKECILDEQAAKSIDDVCSVQESYQLRIVLPRKERNKK